MQTLHGAADFRATGTFNSSMMSSTVTGFERQQLQPQYYFSPNKTQKNHIHHVVHPEHKNNSFNPRKHPHIVYPSNNAIQEIRIDNRQKIVSQDGRTAVTQKTYSMMANNKNCVSQSSNDQGTELISPLSSRVTFRQR